MSNSAAPIHTEYKPAPTNTVISVVSPVYGCSLLIYELYKRLVTELSKITPDFEIILVNDASPDNAWETIKQIAEKDTRVTGINLSRNFGQHYAITAGLDHAKGEWVVVMDCDLQDQPEEIIKLYQKAQEGYDIVLARRAIRFDNFLKKMSSKIFYTLLGYFSETNQDYTVGNFGIYKKIVIDNILKLGDVNKFFPVMVQWVGFKSTKIDVQHAERKLGTTSYSFSKLFNLALNTVLSFSDKPLRMTVKAGLFIVFLSFLMLLFQLWAYFSGQITVPGWASLFISIWFLSGFIIFTLGIVGLYVGKTFDKTKNRPVYIIKETTK